MSFCFSRIACVVLWGTGAPGAIALSFDLVPGVTQGFGKVIVHGARDGDGVGDWLWLSVNLAQTAAEVLLNHRVTHHVGIPFTL